MIPALDILSMNVTEYVEWWTWMELTTNAQKGSCQALTSGQYASLRTTIVISKWRAIKEDFLQYKNQVMISKPLSSNVSLPASKIAYLQDWYSPIINNGNYHSIEEEDDADLLGSSALVPLPAPASKPRGMKQIMFGWMMSRS